MLKNKTIWFVYSVRFYAALISIILIPRIIESVGYEAYGLVGFFSVILACLSILDAGVSGVITKSAISCKSNISSYRKFLKFFNKITGIFLIISIFISIIGFFISKKYSFEWLNSNLDKSVVVNCTAMMFIIFSIRYLQGPQKSILLSSEKHNQITIISFIYATLSNPMALAYLIYIESDIEAYFMLQVFSSLVSLSLYWIFSKKERNRLKLELENKLANELEVSQDLDEKSMLSFAFQLSSLSILWILVNQSDKLTLSSSLALEEYAFYSVAFSVTIILTVLSEPLHQLLLPRFTKQVNEKDWQSLCFLFDKAFMLISVSVFSLASFILFNGKDLVFLWSGDAYLSQKVNMYLPWIFIGVSFSVFSNFTFLLRYSFGRIKNHTRAYAIFAIFVIPSNIYIGINLGAYYLAIFYAVSNFLFFIFWSGYNFECIFSNGLKVMLSSVLINSISSLLYFYVLRDVNPNTGHLFLDLLLLFFKGVGSVAICYSISYISRKIIRISNVKLSH
ncbi:O10 family O-antigen flippase [Vibrio metschnikovii]|nr:O10 family O-antigen flippase [Vibrio metschnikovii]